MIQYPDNTREFQFPEIETNYPVYSKVYPQQNDYKYGSYTRFFVKKINDRTIYEISKENYTEISDNIYIKIAIEWKLAGEKNTVIENKIKMNEGVFEHNKSQINFYKKIMTGLENVLRDPLEFWIPS